MSAALRSFTASLCSFSASFTLALALLASSLASSLALLASSLALLASSLASSLALLASSLAFLASSLASLSSAFCMILASLSADVLAILASVLAILASLSAAVLAILAARFAAVLAILASILDSLSDAVLASCDASLETFSFFLTMRRVSLFSFRFDAVVAALVVRRCRLSIGLLYSANAVIRFMNASSSMRTFIFSRMFSFSAWISASFMWSALYCMLRSRREGSQYLVVSLTFDLVGFSGPSRAFTSAFWRMITEVIVNVLGVDRR